MSTNSDDRRDELCSRFRKYLQNGANSSEYFDEDDLIEIFDYAGDLSDDYLRFEVLLCGARYYPDSIPLKERRALLYSNIGEDVSEKYLEDNADCQGVLWDIARLRNSKPMGTMAIKELDRLLTRYSKFEDEEVIQLVDLASSLGKTDWLVLRLNALRAHVTYLPTLLFEVAVMLEMDGDYEQAIKLLKELTDLEPYNEQYWFMLAQEYDLADSTDDALQALDLALAILPEDKAMRFYHARLLTRNGNSREEAIASLEKLSGEFPEDPDINRFLAAFYIENADDKTIDAAKLKAGKVLNKCFNLNPGNRKLATDLLAIDAAPVNGIIDLVDKLHSPADTDEWIAWANELEDLGAYDKAIEILLHCEQKINMVDSGINEALIIDYFMTKDFYAVCNRFETKTIGGSSASPDNAALIFIAYAISLAKTGRTDEALEFSQMALKFIVNEGPEEITYALRRIGTGIVLTDIIDRCSKETDWTVYDPLCIWDQE